MKAYVYVSLKKTVLDPQGKTIYGALKKMGKSAASHKNLSRQAKSSARKRGSASRHRAAQKAARTRERERMAA